MKKYSIGSISLMLIGIILFGVNWMTGIFYEPIVLLGLISILVGVVLSFAAIAKQEKGNLKFISIISFFVVLAIITWFEPFQIVRMLTWLKNIS
ncbi:hypothetical protein WQ57_05180 [Mesobacillus campisalis]|uniref:DUF4064 domain-containing protein n=1 Tax=Mesobacillus campisalis TaxID=1408103 RepID=A0A0M2T2X3_9BACI|nr:hypothetical protein [Mesobacillus campisalis]KKK39165.1 hypothetical protein WQ57_05180 [Mesobacillus campisalis]